MADAQSLQCPMCGAPASTAAAFCEHCGARLATVACPSCFGLMFVGQKFCPHCGAKAERIEVAQADKELCPRCRTPMTAVLVGKANLRECSKCEGIWADADTLHQICADQEEQAAVLGMADHAPVSETGEIEQQIRYLPCPVCNKLMNRVNFANCSHVIVDVCHEHGTWFDKDELRRIVEFIRAGGLEASRQREIAELEQERRIRSAAQIASAGQGSDSMPRPRHDELDLGLSAAASVLKSLFR